jgi:predicted CXXCH cytochrome family protein
MNNFKMKGSGKMKKTSIVMLLILLSVVLVSGSAYAIGGLCYSCHTMHNSQGGLGEVQTYSGISGTITPNVTTPQQYLLKADCIACHAGSTPTSTNSFGAPIVLHTNNPGPDLQGGGYTLAGGDFYWVATGHGATDSKGHNVAGLAAADVAITPANTPPGFDSGATTGFAFDTVGSTWTINQLSCAGTYGCHGRHDSTGITGAHHGNTGGTATQAGPSSAPTTVGSSYRFLGGIRGLEQSQWNWNETALSHNEYFGVDDTSNRNQLNTAYLNKDTISFSCAECHGFFHSRIDDLSTGTPWLRHPTDIVLKGSGEYTNYTAYSTEAPVARGSVKTSSGSTVTPGLATGDNSAIVMCLSCHRAHGSPEPGLLRWTYSGMVAGGGGADTGCFTCHTSKN